MKLQSKFKTIYLIGLTIALFCQFKVIAQTATNLICPCSGSLCVTTAQELWYYLDPTSPGNLLLTSGSVITICGTINLGEISADKFPLELPATNITLVGDYNFVSGTRIVFPYLYKSGLTCATQQRVVNGEVIEQSLPVDEDEAIDLLTSATSPATAFVFKMQQGCEFKNICLQGPKSDFKEQFMYAKLDPLVLHNSNCLYSLNAFKEKEGLSAGLQLRGNNCNITNSEVYGFPLFNVLVKPEDFLSTPPSTTGRGTVSITNSIIRNSKWWSMGYGLFGSGGGGSNCPPGGTAQYTNCSPTETAQMNTYNVPPEDIYINKCIFMENGKDLDAAGNGYNYRVIGNSLGLRVNGAILNQHNANISAQVNSQLCNVDVNPNVSLQHNPAPCTSSPLEDCCSAVIKHISGEYIAFVNNVLLSGGGEFDFSYPNTWTPSGTCHFPSSTRKSGIDVWGNRFLGETTATNNRIKICKTDHLQWRMGHFLTSPQRGPLNTLDVPTNPPPTTNPPAYLQKNFYNLFTDIVPGVPRVSITAALGVIGGHSQPVSVNSIYAGDELRLNTTNCFDGAGKQSDGFAKNMWFMWRFHTLANDVDDELRSEHYDWATPLRNSFNNIGITNINLIGVDRGSNTTSYIAVHPVTVKPNDNQYHVVFNIKDTYDGPWLSNPTGNCTVTKKTMILPPGTPEPLPPVGGTTSCPDGICQGDNLQAFNTGLEKYFKLNGVIIWHQDIGADAGGWQRIEYPDPLIPGPQMPLNDYLCSDDGIAIQGCPSGINTVDKVEFGIMAVRNVSAILVRGLNLFIDDVYLNNNIDELRGRLAYNENILVNGDFEYYDIANHLPTGWDIINNVPLHYNSSCFSPGVTISINGPGLQNYDVRSGLYSQWFRLKALVSDNKMPPDASYPILTASGTNNILPYFAISQGFNLQQPPLRLAKPSLTPSINLTIKPNPSAFGTSLQGTIQNLPGNQKYQISIYTPEGTLAYLGNGSTSEFTIDKTLPAGVYYVKVWGKGFSNYKRIVVVG